MNVNTIDFESMLHAYGYKLTAQRQAILKIIKNEKDKHLCTEEIYDAVKKTTPRIGLTTVYRTMQLFEKLGIVYHIMPGNGCMKFQIIGCKEKPWHHHLVCEICGEVIDVEEEMLEGIEKKLLSEIGFTVIDHNIQFFGICVNCKRKRIGRSQSL